MNRFLNEDDGLQMAFLDGNQPDRVCAPMKDHIEARGGEVRLSAPVAEIQTNSDDGSVSGLLMRDGSTVVADEYVSAVPCDIFKRMLPKAWSQIPYFRQARAAPRRAPLRPRHRCLPAAASAPPPSRRGHGRPKALAPCCRAGVC